MAKNSYTPDSDLQTDEFPKEPIADVEQNGESLLADQLHIRHEGPAV